MLAELLFRQLLLLSQAAATQIPLCFRTDAEGDVIMSQFSQEMKRRRQIHEEKNRKEKKRMVKNASIISIILVE